MSKRSRVRKFYESRVPEGPLIHLEIGKDSFLVGDIPKMIGNFIFPGYFPDDVEPQYSEPEPGASYLKIIPPPSPLTEEERNLLQFQDECKTKLAELIRSGELVSKNKGTYIPNGDEAIEFGGIELSRDDVIKLCALLGIEVIEHYGPLERSLDVFDPNEMYFKEPSLKIKQQKIIWDTIHKMKYPPKQIPNGGKAAIQKLCEDKYPDVFKSTSFERAWKLGIGHLWQMEFHESYARKGKYI